MLEKLHCKFPGVSFLAGGDDRTERDDVLVDLGMIDGGFGMSHRVVNPPWYAHRLQIPKDSQFCLL